MHTRTTARNKRPNRRKKEKKKCLFSNASIKKKKSIRDAAKKNAEHATSASEYLSYLLYLHVAGVREPTVLSFQFHHRYVHRNAIVYRVNCNCMCQEPGTPRHSVVYLADRSTENVSWGRRNHHEVMLRIQLNAVAGFSHVQRTTIRTSTPGTTLLFFLLIDST